MQLEFGKVTNANIVQTQKYNSLYELTHDMDQGLEESIKWYIENSR